MTGRNILAIDLGTTAVKCALYSTSGVEVACATQEYELQTAAPGHVEVDVEVYWTSIRDCLGDVWRKGRRSSRRGRQPGDLSAGRDPRAGGCVGEGAVPRDRVAGQPRQPRVLRARRPLSGRRALRPDRAAGDAGHLAGCEILLACPPSASHRATYGALPAHRRLPSGPHDRRGPSPRGRLATSTCYWDIATKTWWPAMLDALAVRAEQLPTVVEPGTPVGRLLPAVADELGLEPTTVVCAGALDQACGAIGGGNVAPGGFSENTGAAVAICSTLHGTQLGPGGGGARALSRHPGHLHVPHVQLAAGLC